jgi:hypothetical protein
MQNLVEFSETMKKKKFGDEECCTKGKMNCGACGGGVYFLGFLGALIYYMQQGEGVVGILKAIVWPVFLVMKVLGL